MNYKKLFIENNIISIADFFDYIRNNFKYGWIDKNGKKHYGINDAKTYRLQYPYELLKNKLGICWDMTELYRCFFKNMTSFKYETYYLFYDDNEGCPSHSILVYYDNNKVYWFEPWFNTEDCYYSGIHEYNTITELLKDFKTIFIKSLLSNDSIKMNYNPANFKIYKYQKPKNHINGYEMRNHIDNSEPIILT